MEQPITRIRLIEVMTQAEVCCQNMNNKFFVIITLRVMDGSPEKSSLVFEIARFVAGSINLPRRKMSSSLSLKSRFFSILLFLQFHQILKLNKTDKHTLEHNMVKEFKL